ncbi:MAG: ATP-binding protein, partial [Cyanobacteria bacterium P01_F01_bin.86]
VAFGVAFGVAGGVAFGVALGVALGVAFGVAYGVAYGVALGVALGVAYGVAVGVALGVALGVAFGVTDGMQVGLAAGIPLSLLLPIGFTINSWRPGVLSIVLTPWHGLLYRVDRTHCGQRPSLLRYHQALWDEWLARPSVGLAEHLLLVMERRPEEGQAAFEFLADSRQYAVAQTVQIELDARTLANCQDVVAVGQIHTDFASVSELAGPASSLLRRFRRLSQDTQRALAHTKTYYQRMALNDVVQDLEDWERELTRSSEPYAQRFRPIAIHWHQIVRTYEQALARDVELRQEIESPYVTGVPLNEQQSIFIGRADISDRIEQLIRDRRSPPLLLYGQRRMGKTSLLYNLGRLLPNRIILLFVDLQGIVASASSHAGFLYALSRDMVQAAQACSIVLPARTLADFATEPFIVFNDWLDELEMALGDNTALLALDEFEKLESAFTKERLDAEWVLGLLRNLIQHRPRFKVMLSGAHTLEEFQRWSSYLINVKVIKVSYLNADEARQLIEHPVPNFALKYTPEASQRVLDITRGHPFLINQLCEEIIAYKNEQDPHQRRLACLEDIEAAIPEALDHGMLFFSDIQTNQVSSMGLEILRAIAQQGENAPLRFTDLARQVPALEAAAMHRLLQRDLLEETPDGYRFQVELIRRWFAAR